MHEPSPPCAERGHRPRDQVAVLIVGAGPTGLTLACDLLRRGVSVRLIDRGDAPAPGSRGKAIQPRTLEVFEDLGVIGPVLAQGAEYPRVRVHTSWISLPWRLLAHERPSSAVPYPNVWLLPQARTEAILRERLQQLGGRVERATELVELAHDESSATATLLRNGVLEAQRARYVVGADGAHSRVRKNLGVRFAGAQLEHMQALVGDLCIDGLEHDYWHVWPWAKGGLVSMCPLPHSQLFQLFAQQPPDVELELSERGAQALIQKALGQPTLHLRDATWLSLYRPSARLAERYRVGCVFLAGDAAHVHPPMGAQGLNLGVQDAYNLGWKLAAALSGAPDSLLDSYEEERRPVAAEVLRLSTRMLSRPWRGRGAATKQLRTSYRERSLAAELHCAPRRLRAGDRAPDAIWRDEQAPPRRLFELLRGARATLLTFGPSARRAAEQSCGQRDVMVVHVGARNEHLLGLYGVGRDAVVIVRPDGHIGLIARAPQPDELNAYLDRIGAQPPR